MISKDAQLIEITSGEISLTIEKLTLNELNKFHNYHQFARKIFFII